MAPHLHLNLPGMRVGTEAGGEAVEVLGGLHSWAVAASGEP